MEENYLITIKGTMEQRGDTDTVELMTRGSLVHKDGAYYIVYKETETTGYEGCTTTVKVAEDARKAGVAIATVVSQAISCVLVLRCLYKSEGSYQLRFSKLCLKKDYIIPIFQVGIPAGIQSTVINFSNVLLQSSVNSFGSIAMAGYTAANNVLGFLYTSVNSVCQVT